MSVYVKGMEMPTNCAQCACCDDDARYCHAAHKYIPMVGKPKFCPLVEVKEPQGGMSDLISRQAVIDATKTVMKDILDSLPTTLVDGEEIYDVRTSELDFILNINKALQNAIKALPSETHEIRTETHGVCLDTISRQDTIDAIEHVTWYHQNRNGQMVSGANSDEHQAWYKAEDVYEAIEAVPTANKWIPCSERLPLPDENPVIVSWMGMTNIGWYSCGRWETGTRLPMDGVEAWMPLPEPWKGEEDDNS